MEESGSEGLDEIIAAEATGAFKSVDYVCISDNYWLGKKKPCLTHGLRGISYFSLTVRGPAKDLHSGVFGGTIHEPMTDLIHLMSKLITPDGRIQVPGVYDQVDPVTDEERARYERMEFSLQDYRGEVGVSNSLFDNKVETLMHR